MAALLAIGLGAHVALHLLEPRLALTWSYAHLARRPALPWIATALAVLLPFAARAAWRRPWAARPPWAPGWPAVLAATATLWLCLAAAGLASPAPALSLDTAFFARAVADPASGENARWYLALVFFSTAAHALAPVLSPVQAIRIVNAGLSAAALLCLAGAARRLARTRGEEVAITALAWTAFGTLQPAIGYVDVYPVALAATAAFLWTGLAALKGDMHPAWPLAIAAVGPFWYIGLVLLAPAVPVVALETLRRPGGRRTLAVAGLVAAVAAGLATVPGYGAPFAWGTFWRDAAAQSNVALGYSPTSRLLPASHLFSVAHARDVLHTLLLVDGVGALLALVAGGALLAAHRGAWRWTPATALVGLVTMSYLSYLATMDALMGAFVDWDLFSYGAPATSLLGGWAFVSWGRRCPRPFGLLLGLALAAAGIHLLARLNALDVDLARHLAESPFHQR